MHVRHTTQNAYHVAVHVIRNACHSSLNHSWQARPMSATEYRKQLIERNTQLGRPAVNKLMVLTVLIPPPAMVPCAMALSHPLHP